MTSQAFRLKLTRVNQLKLKVNARIPAVITAQSPIVLDKTGGNYSFSLDMNAINDMIGISFQPADADLTAIAALTTTAYGRSLLTLANATALAAEVDSFFLTPSEGNAAYQPLDSDLTAIAALTTTSYGRAFLALADAAAARTAVGLGNVDNTSDVNKPVSTAQQSALNLKANLASPAFTATITPATNDGATLGTASLEWSDLFLASGAVVNYANGNFTITQATDSVTFAGATQPNNVVTIDTSGTRSTLNVTSVGTLAILALSTGASSASSGSGIIGGLTSDPTAANHRLGFNIFGSNVSGSARNSASMVAWSNEAWTGGSAQGSYLTWETTSNASATRTERMRLYQGLQVGAPTGGDKGVGTINATAVYDDNVLLTCMALSKEFLATGKVDTEFWDNLAPKRITKAVFIPSERVPVVEDVEVEATVLTRVDGGFVSRKEMKSETRPVVELFPVWDDEGNGIDAIEAPLTQEVPEISIPEKIETAKHVLAHRFKAMVDEGFDPRDPKAYIAKMLSDEALPGMPTKAEWQHGDVSTGELLCRLWLAVEMLALVVMNHDERIAVLEGAR